MKAKLLFGKPIADTIYREVVVEADSLSRQNRAPNLRAILVGNDSASIAYLRIKGQMCAELGISYQVEAYPEDTSQSSLIHDIEKLNQNSSITGIIIQLPLPDKYDRDTVLKAVAPEKDIDAFFYTLGVGSKRERKIYPPAPAGMLLIADYYQINLKNQKIVVVGNGLLVGQPLIKMLQERGYSPMLIDSDTQNSSEIIRSADVLFTGVGQPDLITADKIKAGVVIIDAGYSKVNGETRGDVALDCFDKAAAITPAIGGIGPLTVACLLQNAVNLAKIGHNDS